MYKIFLIIDLGEFHVIIVSNFGLIVSQNLNEFQQNTS